MKRQKEKSLKMIKNLWNATKAGRFVRLAFGYVEPGFGDIIEAFVNKGVLFISVALLLCLYSDLVFDFGYIEVAKSLLDIVVLSVAIYSTLTGVPKFICMPIIAIRSYLDTKLFWNIMLSIILVALPFMYFF